MPAICFFNNKGGVGKTTLTCNVASYAAEKMGKRVLLVDADPQCNATQLLLTEDEFDEVLYSVKESSSKCSLFNLLRPFARGASDINAAVLNEIVSSKRFGIDLIPGDPRMSLMEDQLSSYWLEFNGGQIDAGIRTLWMKQLVLAVGDKYDYIFVDVGPSLGALNRSVLIGSEYFLSPMGCDIFSLMGIENISSWLTSWRTQVKSALDKCAERWGSADELSHLIKEDSRFASFVGYTVQQYIRKSFRGGAPRPTLAYEKIRNQIPNLVLKELGGSTPSELSAGSVQLGDVPTMFSLVPLAQSARKPIHRIDSSDGLVGSQYSQKDKYVEFIGSLSKAVVRNVELVHEGR